MSSLINKLEKIPKLWLFDGDGVLYVESKILPGVKQFFDEVNLESFGLLTNNSTSTLKRYRTKLKNFGLNFKEDQIFTSAYIAVQISHAKRAYIIGEDGIFDACEKNNIEIMNSNNDESVDIDTVFVGMDRNFTYSKLAIAMKAILNGAKYIATNPDKTFPGKDSYLPGAGAMIASLNACVNKEPDIIVGKPEKYLFEKALERFNISNADTIMIGDRFETDILGAQKLGIKSILVKTGIGATYTDSQIKKWQSNYDAPNFVVKDFNDILKLVKEI